MTGVEILNSYEVCIDYNFNWSAFWLTTLLIMVVAIVIGIISSIVDKEWILFAVCVTVGAMLSVFAGVFIGAGSASMSTQYETRYQVTISDQVSMNDFLDKYEIIAQDGKIYTVRERE